MAEGKLHFTWPAMTDMPIYALVLGDRLETVGGAPHGFRRAQKQDAAITQGKMEQRENFALSLGAQIDEKVTAADEVEARERRIGQQIMDGKGNHRAQLTRYPIATIFLGEEAVQPRRR